MGKWIELGCVGQYSFQLHNKVHLTGHQNVIWYFAKDSHIYIFSLGNGWMSRKKTIFAGTDFPDGKKNSDKILLLYELNIESEECTFFDSWKPAMLPLYSSKIALSECHSNRYDITKGSRLISLDCLTIREKRSKLPDSFFFTVWQVPGLTQQWIRFQP